MMVARFKPNLFPLQVTMAGDYILSVASIMIARLRSDDVTIVLSQVRKMQSGTQGYD